MSETTEKTELNGRGADGRFTEGNSGRPKGSGLHLTSLLKSKLEEIPKGEEETYKDKFIQKLLDKALIDNDIQALKLIINYVDGLPTQFIEGNLNLYKLNIVRNGEDNKTSQISRQGDIRE